MQTSGTSSGEQPGSNTQDGGDDSVAGRDAFSQALAKEVGDVDGGGDADDDDKGKPDASGGKPQPLPKDLNALAERLGVKVSDLYSLAIPTGTGREALTLGKIKDRYESWNTLEADKLAASEQRVSGEQELVKARAEIQELFSAIPKEHINKDVLLRVAARVAERNKAQDAEVLKGIPEWKDEAIQTADRKEISDLLAGYGLSAPEVKAIRDPRLVKFIRDATRREKQVRAALASVSKRPSKPVQQQTSATGAPRREQPQAPRNPNLPASGREQFSRLLAEG